jgi:hypothetical protein
MSGDNRFSKTPTQSRWSWQAVRYRYRSCAECADEFKALLANPAPRWESCFGDEELTYKLERCIYVFFVSVLSIFDSFAFCLYFVGNDMRPKAFPFVAKPRKITLPATYNAMLVEFPHDGTTVALDGMSKDARFATINAVRNLLAHRLSGRRTMRTSSTRQLDGTFTQDFHQENWHIPGSPARLRQRYAAPAVDRHHASAVRSCSQGAALCRSVSA